MKPTSIRLRPTQPADLPFVRDAEQHPDNSPYIDQWSSKAHNRAINSPEYGHFIVEAAASLPSEKPTSSAVGYTIVSGLQDQNRVLLLKRIVIVQKGKGYGRGAIQQVKKLAFEQLGFHRLWMDVITSNSRAQALYLSEGYVIEGSLR